MTLLSLVEIPGIVLTAAFVEKFNRKSILVAVMLIGGVACTIAALLSPDYSQLKMWLAVLGKCTISGSFALIYVYTVEIFPTVLRISGLGLCSMFARIGGMTAPYLLQLVSALHKLVLTRWQRFFPFRPYLAHLFPFSLLAVWPSEPVLSAQYCQRPRERSCQIRWKRWQCWRMDSLPTGSTIIKLAQVNQRTTRRRPIYLETKRDFRFQCTAYFRLFTFDLYLLLTVHFNCFINSADKLKPWTWLTEIN